MLENEGSEVRGQDGFAEVEFKFWVSMDRKCEDVYWKIKHLRYWDRTDSQNLSLSLGSVWTGKCKGFYGK